MFIENRIKKETKQIVVKEFGGVILADSIEKNLLKNFKRFFRN